MQINNQLATESFHFTTEKQNMLVRAGEIWDLADIKGYCEKIDETIIFEDDIWYIEVEEGIPLGNWAFANMGKGGPDERRFISELISKVGDIPCKDNTTISISLGQYEDSVFDLQGYVACRREILKSITSPEEFAFLMESCFINSKFAEDIVREMKKIDDFSDYTIEIVDNLSVLNDEAVALYDKYHDNLKMAMDILSSKLIECSPDPGHLEFLKFKFCYEEVINGENVAKSKVVTCSPHLKLIHKGSNLRIYFWWKDDAIEKGNKVLIGRIGGHPY